MLNRFGDLVGIRDPLEAIPTYFGLSGDDQVCSFPKLNIVNRSVTIWWIGGRRCVALEKLRLGVLVTGEMVLRGDRLLAFVMFSIALGVVVNLVGVIGYCALRLFVIVSIRLGFDLGEMMRALFTFGLGCCF